jgi:hypothetical protein
MIPARARPPLLVNEIDPVPELACPLVVVTTELPAEGVAHIADSNPVEGRPATSRPQPSRSLRPSTEK